eukprot:364496-Chlamydomonas_euryale.AAC.41
MQIRTCTKKTHAAARCQSPEDLVQIMKADHAHILHGKTWDPTPSYFVLAAAGIIGFEAFRGTHALNQIMHHIGCDFVTVHMG